MRRTVLLAATTATAVLSASIAVALALSATIPLDAQAAEKPNILFVLTDDQYPDSVAHMGALKRWVAAEGVTFDNTVSTYPLCCPGRATIQRGQYAHNTKILGNSPPREAGKSSRTSTCTAPPSLRGWTTPATGPACSAST